MADAPKTPKPSPAAPKPLAEVIVTNPDGEQTEPLEDEVQEKEEEEKNEKFVGHSGEEDAEEEKEDEEEDVEEEEEEEGEGKNSCFFDGLKLCFSYRHGLAATYF